MRRQVKERPSERFTAEEIRVTLEHAQQPFKAMLLVDINSVLVVLGPG